MQESANLLVTSGGTPARAGRPPIASPTCCCRVTVPTGRTLRAISWSSSALDPVPTCRPRSMCASLIAQAAIDVLMERFEFEDEVIDVYRPLLETPFDYVGRHRRPVL